MLLNETKLNKKHKINFNNYIFIRKDRIGSNKGGGTGILIKKELKFQEYNHEHLNSLKYLETCIIKAQLGTNKWIYIISVYYPSGNNNEFLKGEIKRLFETLELDNVNNLYIIAGDINSKHTNWGNSINNAKGVILNNWIIENEFKYRCKLYASEYPSYPRCGSFLDVCLADERIFIEKQNDSTNCLKTLDYDSDHNALQFKIAQNSQMKPFEFLRAEKNSRLNFKKTNLKKLTSNIINSLHRDSLIPNDRNLSNDEIDYHLCRIEKLITDAIEKSVPEFRESDHYQRIVTPIIRKLQSEKSGIVTAIKKHNRMERTLPNNELQFLKNKLKLIKKLLIDNFILSLNDVSRKQLRRIANNDPEKLFFEVKKQFRNRNSMNLDVLKISSDKVNLLNRVNINPQMLRKEENSDKYIISENIHILEVIGAHLESVYSSKDTDTSNSVQRKVNDHFASFLETKTRYENDINRLIQFNENARANDLNVADTDNIFVTRNDIITIFSNLKPKLSSGVDNIPNYILKKSPPLLIFEYLTLFNNMINNAYFPNSWKTAKVIILPKKGKDSTNPENLRAISLLPNISKIFEVCTNIYINHICEENNINCDKQFGFKFKHSTVHAINLLVSNVNWNLNKNLCTGACLIDFEKAFDSVWLAAIICKLLTYNFPFHFVSLLYNMLNNKQFFVCGKDNSRSRSFKMNNGLQQGTVNAPILFNIFIHELLMSVDNIIGFADDIIIYHANNKIEQVNENLQNAFNIVEQYAYDWQMKINIDKCEAILFRPPVNKCNYNIRTNWKKFKIKSRLRHREIPIKNEVKYLGIYLDKFLYFHHHVNNQIEKARRAFHMYSNLFYSKFVHKDVKLLLYKILVRTIITYGCAIWFNISPSYMEKIRKFERKCIRSCTSTFRSPHSNFTKYVSNKKLYDYASIDRIDNYIITLIRNHIIKCTENDCNNLIMAPYYVEDAYIEKTLDSGYVPPEAFLYLDKNGYMQNSLGVPIFYHLYRRATDKSFDRMSVGSNNIRFDISIPEVQSNKNIYWWIPN